MSRESFKIARENCLENLPEQKIERAIWRNPEKAEQRESKLQSCLKQYKGHQHGFTLTSSSLFTNSQTSLPQSISQGFTSVNRHHDQGKSYKKTTFTYIQPTNAGTSLERSFFTGCHGSRRLSFRELLPQDCVQAFGAVMRVTTGVGVVQAFVTSSHHVRKLISQILCRTTVGHCSYKKTMTTSFPEYTC